MITTLQGVLDWPRLFHVDSGLVEKKMMNSRNNLTLPLSKVKKPKDEKVMKLKCFARHHEFSD